jgi:type VI secretion system protein ImpF
LSTAQGGADGTRKGGLRAQLPLLDRLLDADPGARELPPPTAREALEQLHLAVRRDLEALLNARRRRRPLPPLLTELPTSLVNYGIPDPASGAYAVPELRAGLVSEVEATIRRFEPRLTRVCAVLEGDTDDLGGTLRLKIDAVLRADPTPEPVSFETLLEPVTRDVTVREA